MGQTGRSTEENPNHRKGERMIYKRGRYYWYEFELGGKRYRKSTDIIVGKGKPGEKSPKELAKGC